MKRERGGSLMKVGCVGAESVGGGYYYFICLLDVPIRHNLVNHLVNCVYV